MVREVKDFSRPEVPPLMFTIDDDTFTALGEAPGQTVSDLAALAGEDKIDSSKIPVIMQFFDQVFTPESAVLFADRMRGYRLEQVLDETQVEGEEPTYREERVSLKPISFGQLLEIFQWLIEMYMESIGIPTQPRSSSQNGRGGTGRTSTGGAHARAGGLQTAASAGS